MQIKPTITRSLVAGLAVAGLSLGAVACSDDDDDPVDDPVDDVDSPVDDGTGDLEEEIDDGTGGGEDEGDG